MNQLLIVILCLIAIGTGILLFPDGPGAVLVGGTIAGLAIAILIKQPNDKEFLLKVFLIGLVLRILSAIFINVFKLQEFFGPDSFTYDWLGEHLSNYWLGNLWENHPDVLKAQDTSKSGFGINYIVGCIYLLTGRNPLAVQFFCAVVGAATAPVAYLCSMEIFSNKRVSRTCAWITALCPSLVLWSSQALKDGLIIFLLVLSVFFVIQLQKKFNYFTFVILMFSLVGIITLRFYIFYMLVVAIVGCFAVGKPLNPVSILRRLVILLVIGLALSTLMGERATDLDQFNLEKVQMTREDLARGNAGFGKDLDVSTPVGALTALPIGFLYLMLAPFPWQLSNLRQAITLPEMLLWYASIPFLISGLWYSIKQKLRDSIAILLFTMMLTVAYSLYQGNVGTAYRQRAQIQIFHFMFIGVGFTLWQERKENAKVLKLSPRKISLKKISQI